MSRPTRVFLLYGALLALPALNPSERAAPHIIMLYGGMLEDRRIFMTDWHENSRFMVSLMVETDTDVKELAGRPMIQAALFWNGIKWQAYARDSTKLETLTPDMAEQHGRIYPATSGQEPLFVFQGGLAGFQHSNPARLIGVGGLDILEHYGVPTSLQR